MSETNSLTREYETPGPVTFRIEAGSGVVHVEATDTARTVVVVRPAREGDSLAKDLIARTTVEQRGEHVVVEVPRRGVGFLRRSPELDITVGVPAGSGLEAATESADLRTTGRLDAVRIKTGSGGVLLDEVGQAHLQSGSGDVDIERADRSVRVQASSGAVIARAVGGGCWIGTGSGDVRVGTVVGPLQASSGSGDISVDDAGDDVSIDTASGNHQVGRIRRGQAKITSASGDIHIGVGDGTPVWLDVASLTGSVHSALKAGQPPVDGEDSVALRVNTVSGDISLSRAH